MSQQQKNQYINTIFNEFYDNVIKEYNNKFDLLPHAK